MCCGNFEGMQRWKGVRCIVIPATQKIYLQAMEEGLLKIFIEAGAVVSTHLRSVSGWLYGDSGRGRALYFHYKPEFCRPHGTYKIRGLSGKPGAAAASAVTGKISVPEELGL